MDNKPEFKIVYKRSGEAVDDVSLMSSMYHEYMEGMTDEKEWSEYMECMVQSLSRFELYIVLGSTVVGAAVLVEEYDMHVGQCISIVFQYIRREYRAVRLVRAIVASAKYIAKTNGVKWIALAKRVSATAIKVRYVWVK